MKERIRKHSVTIAGHRTSLSLEEPFWEALKREALHQSLSINALVEKIDAQRPLEHRGGNLSSAIRIYLFTALQDRRGQS